MVRHSCGYLWGTHEPRQAVVRQTRQEQVGEPCQWASFVQSSRIMEGQLPRTTRSCGVCSEGLQGPRHRESGLPSVESE
jgi:hypothetical protein